MLRNLFTTTRIATSIAPRQALSNSTSKLYFGQFPFVPICQEFHQPNLQLIRSKSKGGKKISKYQTESENEESEDKDLFDEIQDKHTKTLKLNVTSMRLDAILRAALGIARNKIEVIFYESKIRINGEKLNKKSISVQEGDEIDVIKGVNMNNPNFLTVARIEILSVDPKEENISVKIRRCKSLMVDNYDGRNSWNP